MKVVILYWLCSLLVIWCTRSAAQPYFTYGANKQDSPDKIIVADNKLVIVGSGMQFSFPDISDGFVLAVSKDLDSLYFTYHLDTADTESYYSFLPSGEGYFVCGVKANYCCDSSTVATLTRLNADFSIDTTYHFDGDYDESFHDIFMLGDHIYLLGRTQSFTTETPGFSSQDPYIVKCDLDGNVVWQKHPGTVPYEDILTAAASGDQHFYLGGAVYSNDLGKAYIVKVDTAGNPVWRKTMTPGNQYFGYFFSIQPMPDGGCVAWGTKYGADADVQAPYIVRFNANGDTVWTKTLYRFNEPDNSPYNKRWNNTNVGGEITTLASGDFIAVGDWYDLDASNRQIFIYKFDAYGDSIWRIDLGDSWPDHGYSVTEDDEGFIYAAGAYSNPETANGSKDVLIIKLDENGCTVDTCLVTALHQPVSTQANAFTLYPNPATEVLHIRSTNPFNQDNELFIRDASGRTILHQAVSSNATVSVKALSAGVYVAELRQRNGERFFQKFVKQ